MQKRRHLLCFKIPQFSFLVSESLVLNTSVLGGSSTIKTQAALTEMWWARPVLSHPNCHLLTLAQLDMVDIVEDPGVPVHIDRIKQGVDD